jgi:prepilin-type N-terminal cleavage/methylation domain-containing protein
MNMTSHSLRQRGFSLIELMISVTISLVILGGLSAMLVNVSRTNAEMAKSNSQIENGRFAVEALETDLVHAGFWGEYVPQFDDLSWLFVPSDAPTSVPDPCLAYNAANWDFDYINNILGIPVQTSDSTMGTCTLSSKAPNTDVLVVRHAATCLTGEANCDPDTAGKLNFQSSMCTTGTYGTAESLNNDSNHIGLQPPSASSNTSAQPDGYKGMTIKIVAGTGAGQVRTVSAFSGITFVATVTPNWTTTPDSTSKYTIVDEVLSTSSYPLRQRSCLAADLAPKRKFESSIYYIRSYATDAGDGIPTLVRSSFDPAGPPALAHQEPQALVEGIERFAVELGIDNIQSRCGFNSAVDYTVKGDYYNPATCAVDNVNKDLNSLPKNRGDGSADSYVHCTAAVPCTVEQLRNVVSTKLYLLVRNTERTLGYIDTKTYCLATLPVGGVCPGDSVAGPFNDGFKRHLFSTTVRLTTISGRRETP